MSLQKRWEKEDLGKPQDKSKQMSPKVAKVEYEIVQKFNHKGVRVNPKDKLPNDISKVAMESLIRRGVLRALKE